MNKVSYQKITKLELFGKCLAKLETVYNEQSDDDADDTVEYYISKDYFNDEFRTDNDND